VSSSVFSVDSINHYCTIGLPSGACSSVNNVALKIPGKLLHVKRPLVFLQSLHRCRNNHAMYNQGCDFVDALKWLKMVTVIKMLYLSSPTEFA